MSKRPSSHFRPRSRQSGVVLIVALLVLVVTVLAAVALVRSVDVATLVAGNLAFRQAAVQATDKGVETALSNLMAVPSGLLWNRDGAARPWYWPMRNGGVPGANHVFDPTDPAWNDYWADGNDGVLYSNVDPAPDAQGNRVRYAVHRMCENFNDGVHSGDPGTSNCFSAKGSIAEGVSQRIREPGDPTCYPSGTTNLCAPTNPYYRITVMVVGPRGTSTFAQAVIY